MGTLCNCKSEECKAVGPVSLTCTEKMFGVYHESKFTRVAEPYRGTVPKKVCEQEPFLICFSQLEAPFVECSLESLLWFVNKPPTPTERETV